MTNLFEPEKKAEKALIQKAQKMQQPHAPIQFSVAVLSAFGWYMSIPVLCGIAIGRFLDAHFPIVHFSWTLNCIFIGFAVGIGCVTYWVRKEGMMPLKKADLSKDTSNKKQYKKDTLQ